jgi:hypothetical protein
MADSDYINQLESISVEFSLRNFYHRQELGHKPTDFTQQSAPNDFFGDVIGYNGPGYDEDKTSEIQFASQYIRSGLILPVNNSPGAPHQCFVYGATNQDNIYQSCPNIKAAYGPNLNQMKGIAPNPTDLFRITNQTFIPGQIRGMTQDSILGQYVPSHPDAFPINIDLQERKNVSYSTNNIWEYFTGDQRWSSANTEFFYNQAINETNRKRGSYIFQILDHGHAKIGFYSLGSRLSVKKYDDRYFFMPKGATWYFNSSYWDAQRLNLQPAIPASITPSNLNNVSLFKSQITRDSNANGINCGFQLNFEIIPATDVNAFKDGFPSVVVDIGEDLSIDGYAVRGARVILAAGRPATISFPVIKTNSSRYLTTIQQSAYSNITQNLMHTCTSKRSLTYPLGTSGLKCTVQFEGFGDFGRIQVAPAPSSPAIVEGIIGPQMGVSSNETGIATDPEISTSSYCAINGKVRLEFSNVNGNFQGGPICYRSWDATGVMFKHLPFELSTSSIFMNKINTDLKPYADVENAYGFNQLQPNSLSTSGSSRYKYPDAVKDPRGDCPIVLSVLTDASNSTTGSLSVSSTNWSAPVFVGGSGSTVDQTLVQKYGIDQLKRGQYLSASYGNSNLKSFLSAYKERAAVIWAHTYQSGQLLTVWPNKNHRAYFSTMRSIINASYSLPTSTIKTKDVKSLSLRSALEGCLIKRTGTINLINSSYDVYKWLEQMGGAAGNKMWVKFDIKTKGGQTFNYSAVVTNLDIKSTGAGREMTIQFQDPLTKFLETLPYPGSHSVDGWQIADSVLYVLARLGLRIDTRLINNIGTQINPNINIWGVGPARMPYPRIGRWIATDIQTREVKFEDNMKDNLRKAIGILPIYEYPVFYWGAGEKIHYKDTYSVSYSSLPMYSGFDEERTPVLRDSYSINYNNQSAYFEQILITKDRFRGVPIWRPLAISQSRNYCGYRSRAKYNVERIFTDTAEISSLANTMERQNVYLNDIEINYRIAGLLPHKINEEGGCGHLYATDIPYTKLFRKLMYLKESNIDWNASNGDYITTDVKYAIKKPAALLINSDAIIGR